MPQQSRSSSPKPKKLLDQARDKLRLKSYTYETEKSYVGWIKRYILFHQKRHPAEMGKAEVEAFLTHLAVEENVAPSTQNQALLFLYRDVLERPIAGDIKALRAKQTRRLPTVLTVQEVQTVLKHLTGVNHLVALLLYGSGLRVNECLSLRVKDITFEACEITVRAGKGAKDRMTMLPQLAIPEL
jgi:integrase